MRLNPPPANLGMSAFVMGRMGGPRPWVIALSRSLQYNMRHNNLMIILNAVNAAWWLVTRCSLLLVLFLLLEVVFLLDLL